MIALLVLHSAGCSGDGASGAARMKTVPLTGTISLDGKPHGSVSVQFLAKSAAGGSRTAYAQVKADGSFAATTYVTGDGIIPGKYDVRLGSADDAASTDPAKLMSAAVGSTIEGTEIDVPEDGLSGIEIKFTSSKSNAVNPAGGAMLGQ
jgi:hypothetical protein